MLLQVQLLVSILIASTLALFQDFNWRKQYDLSRVDNFEGIRFHSKSTHFTGKLREGKVLTCAASGKPGPTMYWLKDGVRISRSNSSIIPRSPNMLDYAMTVSNLRLECVTKRSTAVYTCVAESPLGRIYQNHTVIVDARYIQLKKPNCTFLNRNGFAAEIFMFTKIRSELTGKQARLYCRAYGVPRPIITWFKEQKEQLNDGKLYRLAINGDLIIKKTTSASEGVYTCQAQNSLYRDSQKVWLSIIKVPKKKNSTNPSKTSTSPLSDFSFN